VSARRSDRVLTVSRASRDDLVNSLGVPREKIDVAHSGPGLAGSTTPTPEDELRRRLDLGDRRLLLSPSARRAHKNLPRLLEAFAAAEQAREALLVLPGYETGAEDELAGHAAELGIAERVRCAGWVSDEDLLGLYAAATALVFPSLAEGFGLPILEAMSAGLPVACSNTSSLPEIAGDAALLFDPTSVDAMTGAIDRILSNGPLREDLRERGRRQAARFTWAAAAEQTIASYRRALAAA
jgi:glycosyltransferase involved in cell wall biosynthesis